MKKFLVILMVVAVASFLFGGCLFTVPVAVTGVTLDQETMTLTAEGATGTLLATVEPPDATDTSVTWDSSDKAVASVALGVVTPLTVGITDITVTTVDGGLTATCAVTVTAAEEPELQLIGIEVDPKTMDLFEGESVNIVDEIELSVTAIYEISGYEFTIDLDPSVDCTYLTGDSDIVKVDDAVTGNVTAVGVGTADILVEYEGKTDTIVVTVIAVELDHILVDPKTMDLTVDVTILEGVVTTCGLGTDDTIDSVVAYYNDDETWDIVVLPDEDCTFDFNSTIVDVNASGLVTVSADLLAEYAVGIAHEAEVIPLAITITVSYTDEGITETDTIEVTVTVTVAE